MSTKQKLNFDLAATERPCALLGGLLGNGLEGQDGMEKRKNMETLARLRRFQVLRLLYGGPSRTSGRCRHLYMRPVDPTGAALRFDPQWGDMEFWWTFLFNRS